MEKEQQQCQAILMKAINDLENLRLDTEKEETKESLVRVEAVVRYLEAAMTGKIEHDGLNRMCNLVRVLGSMCAEKEKKENEG